MVYTQIMQPVVIDYLSETMTYIVTGSFTCTDFAVANNMSPIMSVAREEGNLDWSAGDWAVPHAKLPLFISMIHQGRNIDGTAVNQGMNCYPARRIVKHTTAGGLMEVMVIMEGRVPGVHRITTRTQMTSEILYHNLRLVGAETVYRPLGQDFEGVARDVPMIATRVEHCVTMTAVDAYIAECNLITGSVNEAGWRAPWLAPVSPAFAEGEYIYLGPVATAVNRTSRTALIAHEFARLQSRNKQQIYEWLNYTQVLNPVSGMLDRQYAPAVQSGYIQKVAGTDTWWDGVTLIPTFASLLLNPILF